MPNLTNINFYGWFFKAYLQTILICYPHEYNPELSHKVKNYKEKKLVVISEPIKNADNDNYRLIYNDLSNNVFDINFGCVIRDISNNKIKFPIYLLENNFPIFGDYNQLFLNINNAVKNSNIEMIKSKQFCTLINRWDPVNVRTCMYNKLKTINNINCPSQLFNNCSNNELNYLGKTKYINKFLFNICSENWDNGNMDGYITEKIMDACLGGAIPIYAGWFDEYDTKIFNKNRILFYNSQDELSIETIYNKVLNLINHPEELIEFYRQPVFCDTAIQTIELFKKDLIDKINT